MRVRTKPYFPGVTGVACLTDASAGLACLGVASDMTPEEVASLLSNCMSHGPSPCAYFLLTYE